MASVGGITLELRALSPAETHDAALQTLDAIAEIGSRPGGLEQAEAHLADILGPYLRGGSGAG